jgi:hypothetical protein
MLAAELTFSKGRYVCYQLLSKALLDRPYASNVRLTGYKGSANCLPAVLPAKMTNPSLHMCSPNIKR